MTSQVYGPKGHLFDDVPAEEFPNLRDHLDDNTRMVWIESPSNPMLNVVDLQRAADAAHEVGAFVLVDNTFATPFLQQPLSLGADAVIALGDEVSRRPFRHDPRLRRQNDPTIAERLYFLQKSLGADPGAVRRVARAARDQDAAAAHAPAL